MGKYENRLKELGIELPEMAPPVGAYVPAVRTGNLVFCSGKGPHLEGKLAYRGKVGPDVSLEDGYQAARLAGLNCLAEIRHLIGSLDKVKRIVQVRGFVNCLPEFEDQPKVMNGAFELFLEIFGENGQHVRCALGTNSLPSNIPVEVEMIVEVE